MTDSRPKSESAAPPIEVPLEALSPEALNGVIEGFVLQEGTDYGREEVSLAKKIEQVRRQIERGDVKIVFDPDSESVGLLTSREFLIRQKKDRSDGRPERSE